MRHRWPQEQGRLRAQLKGGCYRFEPLSRVTDQDGEVLSLWSARDSLVLKMLSHVLAEHLPISGRGVHVKGHGGAKVAVRQVRGNLAHNRFVLRTDVKDYYASIDHFRLLDRLSVYVKDRRVMNLLGQYLRRSVEWGGLFKDIDKGTSRGCPLSPLIGAFFLKELDEEMERSGLFYVHYMDDILVLAPTRWKLRAAVKTLNQVFNRLGLEKHPEKTFIGRIEKGFDFLGYHFNSHRLSLAEKTVENFVSHLHRLYEQQQSTPEGADVLGAYVRRWMGWAEGGLGEVECLIQRERRLLGGWALGVQEYNSTARFADTTMSICP